MKRHGLVFASCLLIGGITSHSSELMAAFTRAIPGATCFDGISSWTSDYGSLSLFSGNSGNSTACPVISDTSQPYKGINNLQVTVENSNTNWYFTLAACVGYRWAYGGACGVQNYSPTRAGLYEFNITNPWQYVGIAQDFPYVSIYVPPATTNSKPRIIGITTITN